MIETLFGGLLAILGGFSAIWYQLRNTKKTRMDEVTAERKITANAQAYSYIKLVQSSITQSDTESTLKVLIEKEGWFFDNRLFLPGAFPDKWLQIRNDLSRLKRWDKTTSKKSEDLIELETSIEKTIVEAIDEIYKDMNLERIDLDKVK